MNHAADFLNEKQIGVLRWIAAGSDEHAYPAGDFSHRITARALANRGLVKLSGRGATWHAKMTPQGFDRLKTAPAADHRKDTPALDLYRRVEAAGGTLQIDVSSEAEDVHKLVDGFIRDSNRPHGKRLDIRTIGNGWFSKTRELTVVTHFIDLAQPSPVPIPKRLVQPHESTRLFLDEKDFQYVSAQSEHRAATVYEAIAREAEKRGHVAGAPKGEQHRGGTYADRSRGHLTVETSETLFRIAVREIAGQGSVKMDWNKEGRLPRWQQNRAYSFVPTSRLEIRVEGPGTPYQGHKLRETKHQSLESILPRAFQLIEAATNEHHASRIRREADLARRVAQWEAAMAEARRRYAKAEVERQIVDYAERLDAARKVDVLREALEARLGGLDGESRDNARSWITWAAEIATPEALLRNLPEIDYREPNPADLKPYLDGWDVTPPTR